MSFYSLTALLRRPARQLKARALLFLFFCALTAALFSPVQWVNADDGAIADAASAERLEEMPDVPSGQQLQKQSISPYWAPSIQVWSDYIQILSATYGFDPDFIAAVIRHESSGDHQVVSYMGAVGLMGVMPTGPGLEWRPSSETLLVPAANLRYGMAILSQVVKASGGDLFAALAAYNGGWDQVNSQEPRQYAASVLDSYARALVARQGMAPDTAAQWTIAVEIVGGNVPVEPLLVLGREPISELRLFAEHTVYRYADNHGQFYYVRGYAVPVGLTDIIDNETAFGEADELEAPLLARLGDKAAHNPDADTRVILACLSKMPRLRGQVTTRWYSPSSCPVGDR